MDDLNLGVIIAQIINFGALFFIFKHFLGDKLVGLINDRKTQLEKMDNVESDVKARLEKADEEAEKTLVKAREKALEIEKSSANLAKKSKEKVIAEAEMQADSIISGARADIEKEKLSMMSGIKSKVIDLSLKLNAKLFTSEKANKDFMEKELNSINP